MKHFGRKYLPIVSLLLLQGCVQQHLVPLTQKYLQQEPNQCGPHALSMVLRHAGYDFSAAKIADEIFDRDHKVTSSLDMLLYARSQGAHAVLTKSDYSTIINLIISGIPVLVALYTESEKPVHYVVAYGARGSDLVVHDGYMYERIIPFKVFMKRWEAAGYMALWIPESPTT